MSGIYIHIPFCKQACHYCDFHFSTNLSLTSRVVESIQKEIVLRTDYINQPIESIYFGGGTPSIIPIEMLKKILSRCHSLFEIKKETEITIEINPDDITEKKLWGLKNIGINRLSIGIQSFDEATLKYLNRAHNAIEAIKSVKIATELGFESISIDLIYGIPMRNNERLLNDICIATNFDIQHISAYCLTIENGTVFGNWKKNKKIVSAEEDFVIDQYGLIHSHLSKHNYQQYEISNYCKDEKYSKHNTAYWQRKSFLGVGPSAHSYNSTSRQSNINNNLKYIRGIENNQPNIEIEELSLNDKINESLLTGLRTKWGVDLNLYRMKEKIDYDYISNLIKNKKATLKDDLLKLTNEGLLLADKFSSDLFIIDNI